MVVPIIRVNHSGALTYKVVAELILTIESEELVNGEHEHQEGVDEDVGVV